MFTCNTCGESFHSNTPYNAHIHTAHLTAQPTNSKHNTKTSNEASTGKTTKKTVSSITSQASDAGSSWVADQVLIPSSLTPTREENITQTHHQH